MSHFAPFLQWPSSPTLSSVLVQSQVVSPSVVMRYTNPVGCGLPHLPSLVSQMKCDDRCSVTSSRTQPFLLYGITTSYPLARTGSHTTCATSLGTSVVQSICERLLRNSTAVVYIRKWGGTHSQSLFYKTLELFALLYQFVITFQKIQNLGEPRSSWLRHIHPGHGTLFFYSCTYVLEFFSWTSNCSRMCPTSDAPKFHRDPRLLDLDSWKLSRTSWKVIIARHCRRYDYETHPEFLR